jgi:glycosyltransferase involved in cell wall biosynthesis
MKRIAYLVNQYPKTSHTFIRREILALETEGCSVDRFAIRPSTDDFIDQADRAEAKLTRALLEEGPMRLIGAVFCQALTRPRRFFATLATALRLGWRSERGVVRHLAYLAEACLLQQWLTKRGIEHLHAHFGTNSAMVAMLCHLLEGPPYSFTVHGPEEFDKPAFIALGEKIGRAAFTVAISSHGRSQLLRHSSTRDWPRIHVVRCGLDESYLGQHPSPVPNVPRLVCVGRLSEQKGQLLLLEAAAALEQTRTPFELVLAGDGEMRREIELGITRLGLGERVRITGWLDDAGIRREIESARALVLPSFAEGLPVVIMEAFALGRPVLSTYVAGIPELVVANESGWLVPAGSATELADAMRQVLEMSVETLTIMGLRGRERVLAVHDARLNARLLWRHVEAVS